MAGYFDLLRDKTEGELDLENQFVPRNPSQDYSDLNVITAQDEKEATQYRRAGFHEGETPNTFITPSRQVAERASEREYLKQLAREKIFKEKQNSTMFKIGDTLADTGRLFLSPIFWLSGKDTTAYDPSERLRAGYRGELEQSRLFTDALYTKVVQARQSRLNFKRQLDSDDLNRRKTEFDMAQPSDTFGKAVFGFAQLTNQMDAFKSGDPAEMQRLFEELQISQNTAKLWGSGKVISMDVFNAQKDIKSRYQAKNEKLSAVYDSFRKLQVALASETGIGDVAGIFTFMKTLDPESVVREGEFAMAAGASGIFAQLANIWDKSSQGKKLPPEARQQMLRLSEQFMEQAELGYNNLYTHFSQEIVDQLPELDDAEDVRRVLGDRRQSVLSGQPNNQNMNTDVTVPDVSFNNGQGPLRPEFLEEDQLSEDQLSRALRLYSPTGGFSQ